MKSKILYLISFILLSPSFLTAQDENKTEFTHEIGIHLLSGVSNTNQKVNIIQNKVGFGYGFGVDYNFMFHKNFGITTGIEYVIYNSKAIFDDYSDSYKKNDDVGDDFDFVFSFSNATEKQRIQYLNIPILANFETSGNIKFYSALGIKIGIPINYRYQTEIENINTNAYYNQHDLEIDDLEFMGFGNYEKLTANKKLKLAEAYSLSVELGIKLMPVEKQSLSIGFFADYSLNEITKGSKNNEYIQYDTDNPTCFTINSVISSYNNINNKTYTKKNSLLIIGLKIKYNFGL